MLTLKTIGIRDYNVRESGQTIGRIRYASERTPGVWLWHVQIHVTGGLPVGSATSLDQAKAEFKAAWEKFRERVGEDALARAFEGMKGRS